MSYDDRPGHPLRMIQIPRPGREEEEEDLAEFLAGLLRRQDDRDIGVWTGRDGDAGVRVDFLYDDTSPPVALEITSIRDGDVAALGAAIRQLERRLDDVATVEGLGSWSLGIRVGTRVSELEGSLVSFLRHHGRRNDEPALFDVENAPDDLAPDDLKMLVGLFDRGLQSALRVGGGNGVSIFPPISQAGPEVGFGTLLREAIASNAAKLGETRPRETHLLVTLEIRVSSDPSKTPIPTLPESIDFLWVYLGYWNAKYDYRLWRATRVDRRWQLLNHPLGQPAIWRP